MVLSSRCERRLLITLHQNGHSHSNVVERMCKLCTESKVIDYNVEIPLLHIFSFNSICMVILSILKRAQPLNKLQMHSGFRYQVMLEFLGTRKDPENISSQNKYILYVGVWKGNTFLNIFLWILSCFSHV